MQAFESEGQGMRDKLWLESEVEAMERLLIAKEALGLGMPKITRDIITVLSALVKEH